MASPIDGGAVLVTGASSCIRTAIARQVAPRAKTLVLVARRVQRLAAISPRFLRRIVAGMIGKAAWRKELGAV